MSASEKEAEIKAKARAMLAARAHVNVGQPMPAGPKPALVTAETVDPDTKAWDEACEQVRLAKESARLPASAFLQYPIPALAKLVRGVRPNRVHQIVMGSNVGKTTLIRSLIASAVEAGQSCAVVTTETPAPEFRVGLAATEIGVDPGDFGTGEIHDRADADAILTELDRALDRWKDYESGSHRKLIISGAGAYLTPQVVRTAAREAADLGADWFFVDHVDHVESANGLSETGMSNAVNTALWRAAADYDLRVICTGQLNQEVFRQMGPLGMCTKPQEHWVKYGGKKKELCWVMLGGWRPLRPFADEEERQRELAAFKKGQRTISEMTLPGIAFANLKHRDKGGLVGTSCILEVRHGRVHDTNQDLYKSTRHV